MAELTDIVMNLQRFSWPDYLVLMLMLFLCILIGIYFGVKQKSTSENEYLMGGRTMSVFPIAMSLVASFISGITLLGLPTEIYSFGIQYLYVIGGVAFMGLVMGYVYLPVFHDLNITSTYEYLESRFDKRLRMFGSVMFAIMNIGYLPIVVYVPALAFNQVTGVNIHVITPIVCVVCVFYTSLGGLKAVVWTDVVQSASMFGALILVAVKGSIDLGGADIVFKNALDTKRIEGPNFDIDPTVRHTIWSQIIGGLFYWTQTNAVSQNMIQRYLSLPTLKHARRALWIFIFGVVCLMLLCSYNGLLIYATYRNCDPLTTKVRCAPLRTDDRSESISPKARDQLLPLFVMDVLGEFPGLSGLFIAGVFSAALSSLSTCLNSMSAVVLEDFVKPFVEKPLSNKTVNWIMRSVVVVVGAICVALVVVVEKMGTVLQLTMSLEAITNGPLLGIFTIGILLPWIDGNSALAGGVAGVIAMSWVSLNAQWAIASGAIRFEHKTTSVGECDYEFDVFNVTKVVNVENVFPLYRISYMWYTFFGAMVAIIVSCIWTSIFGGNDPADVDSSLLTPSIRNRFSKRNNKNSPREEICVTESSF
ncbi:Sodium-coupled monocarboxylate transporter 1 [Pseudolycoriella hygida]|uniref:Sodium-coupled monocarboxylate transporter 1 n=1 Tax=Pseudolycoriella hygida TaxID=35572 RepID=A0A9Q0MRT4_9DIPT|nr:Sodium-coupled monocarboxylate transporter 1 [Pseudolycoriella hygida]